MSNGATEDVLVYGVEMAAGGLVWDSDGKGVLAVVRRTKHRDWALPKGRPEPNETMETTANREAMEETGWKTTPGALAGSFSYSKNGHLKIVLMWHMARGKERYEMPAPRSEIEEVAWLSPAAAVVRLTHQTERDFVMRHCLGANHRHNSGGPDDDPELARLAAALQTLQERLTASLGRTTDEPGVWWAASACRSLDAAESAFRRMDVDAGWGALHDTERFLVFGMADAELVTRAASLKAEVNAKLKGWRAAATSTLFAPIGLNEWLRPPVSLSSCQRTLLQQVVVESLSVLHDESNNTYHRMRLVGKQLRYLVWACVIVLAIALGLSVGFARGQTEFGPGRLLSVAVSGALGGVVSAMYQLTRVGHAKIPESLLHGLVTSGRPLIGAASALFIYAVLLSGVVSLIDPTKVNLAAALVLGFVAGFSERFVLATVAKVAGTETDDAKAQAPKSPPTAGDRSAPNLPRASAAQPAGRDAPAAVNQAPSAPSLPPSPGGALPGDPKTGP